LTINGSPVPVLPNGSFLAFLPVPPRDKPVYDLVASRGRDTVRVSHGVRLGSLPADLSAPGAPLADPESVSPRATLTRRPAELVRVRVRAAPLAIVTLESGGKRIPFGVDSAAVRRGDVLQRVLEVEARLLSEGARIVVARGSDTLHLEAPQVSLSDPDDRALGVVGVAASTLPDTDRVVIARPVEGGTYKWFLLPGTVVPVTGRTGSALRVRLDRQLEVWVDSAEVGSLGDGALRPVRVAGNARVVSGGAEWSDLIIPVGERPPYSVETTPRGLTLTLYGTTGNTDIIGLASNDSLVERVTWIPEATDRVRFDVDLRAPAFGYLVRFERNSIVLRIRRAPEVDRARPLAGLTIAVDAGHPPAGSTGPTGLYEAVATLGIAQRLRTTLEQRGATVVMTRDGPSALGLNERPLAARRANAHAFVSIHLNALPDGVNPFRAHGTGTYYFTGQSLALARQVQRGMVARMGLRDLGVFYDNLAVLRPTWMPAVLCEGAFLMIPEQEAALRTPEFQEAYAAGVADGLEAFFRALVR
jgi:N-acetylmuramoyl-L-alanine amidase